MGTGYSVDSICDVHGISRQAYYNHSRRLGISGIEESIVLKLVREIRREHPRMGGRKLYNTLKEDLNKIGRGIGRDKLFDILRSNGLLIKPLRKYVKTTNSHHRFRVYKNLIEDIEIKRSNQVFVSDITYLSTYKRFYYLSLVTDVYSRKIVGYNLSDSLSLSGSLKAIKMALRGVKDTKGLIHHSDRGIQYCSNQYTQLLKRKGVGISMAGKGNAYENAIAERVNGILKIEYLLDRKYPNNKELKRAVNSAIKLYNEKRPHMSLGYDTPAQRYAA
jgi:transposase InsO family protein